jgi:3-methyladenine DNA glycosylase/8-oxoguanine DNA glycosylase
MNTSHIQLSSPNRLPLRAIVRSHGWCQLWPLRWEETDGVLSRTEQLGAQVVELDIRQAGEQSLDCTVRSTAALSAADQAELTARLCWMLSLDVELDEFYRLCAAEPKLAHVPREGKGRILRSPSLFEDAVKCICTTNTTWAQTKGMVRRLVERLGAPGPVDEHRAFPAPQAVAAAGEALLKDEVRLGYRSPYVHQLALSVAHGELDLETLRVSTEPTPELRGRLLAIKGIGPYAAATLLNLLGHYDHIGVDTWARKLVSSQFYAGQPVTDADVQAAFESFGSWRALAFWFYDWDEM